MTRAVCILKITNATHIALHQIWQRLRKRGFAGWANVGGLGGHFFISKLWLVGVPGPGCMRCMRANFILGNGASWCSGQPSPSNFSLKLKLNAGRILERAAPASIFAFASQPPTPQSPTPPLELQLGSETQNQEANTIMRSCSAVAGIYKVGAVCSDVSAACM